MGQALLKNGFLNLFGPQQHIVDTMFLLAGLGGSSAASWILRSGLLVRAPIQ